MTLKKIIWTGPEKFIPDVGKVIPGSEKFVEKELADSFIKQGLATGDKEVKFKPKTEEN